MTTIYVGLGGDLLVLRGERGTWEASSALEGTGPGCVAADPARPDRVWCGTAKGLWRSVDAGRSWSPGGRELQDLVVSAVAVTPDEEAVYAGIDQSALWRSRDGGSHWERLAAFNALPSAATWSFPPRPDTSHVRWISVDPGDPDHLYVCVEAGALVESADGGATWSDRVEGGPLDTHTLAVHPGAPGRLYSAAGDGVIKGAGFGYNESRDAGATWEQPDAGIERHYLYGLAVDAGDPEAIVVSAAASPRHAHDPGSADSTVYRRSNGGPWQEALDGLPESPGMLRTLFSANAAEPGVFYAANNGGVFRSGDQGRHWETVVAPLPLEGAEHGAMAILATG